MTRFVESILVGVPLFYLMFFVVLLATGADAYFLPEEGVPISGTFFDGFGGVSDFENTTGLSLKEEMKTQPFDDTNRSGVFATISVASQGIGFIKNIINLELKLLELPLQNVAGVDDRKDVIIFNNLFWSLFVLPSHLLMGFAILFFVRSG
jgi:hypothetical protein